MGVTGELCLFVICKQRAGFPSGPHAPAVMGDCLRHPVYVPSWLGEQAHRRMSL